MIVYWIFACFIAGITAQITGQGPCAGQKFGAYIPDPKSCARFYQCISANETLHDCSPGTYWSSVYKVCVFPLQADCTLEPGETTVKPTTVGSTYETQPLTPDETTITTTGGGGETTSSSTTGGGGETTPSPTTDDGVVITPPPIQKPCTGMEAETFGDPEDCTLFTYCYLGVPTIVKCPIGEYYSKDDNACIEAEECPGDGQVIIPPCTSMNPEIHGDPNDCGRYTYCENGMPHIVQCAIGEFFSEEARACIEAAECPTSPGVTPPCTSDEYEVIEIPDDCTKYIYCDQGNPLTVQCATGEYFSMEHQGCIKADTCPDNGGGGTSTQSTTTTTTERPITPPCSSLESETMEDPKDCSKFIYCYQGYPYTVQCNPGTYYSKEHDGCIYASECPSGGESGSGSTTPPTTTIKPPITAPCTSDNLEVHGNPEDCTQYFYCYEGFPYVVQCQLGSYFSEEYKVCIEADQCPADVETTTDISSSESTTHETTSSPIIDPCTSLGPEVFGDPDDCTQYTYCYLGEPHTVQCAIGEYFSEDYGVCIEAFECPATATATPSTVTPSPTPSISPSPTSPITTPTIDTSSPTPPITIPTAGTPSPTPSVTPSPTSPITTPTIDTSSPTSPITIPTIGTSSPTTPTTETTPPPNPIIPPCSSYEPEFIPNPDDCSRYIYCCVGIPIPMQCNEGEYFSESDRMCIKSSECPQGTTPTTESTTISTTGTPSPTPSVTPSPTPPITTPTIDTSSPTPPITIPTAGTPSPTPSVTPSPTSPITVPTIDTSSPTPPITIPTTIPTTDTPSPTPSVTVSTDEPTSPITTPTTEPPPVVIPPCTSMNPEIHGDPNDCDRYTYCENGIPHTVQCAIGEFFSEEALACVEAAECPTTPGVTPPCTSNEYEIIEVPDDCTKYIYCDQGNPFTVQCANGEYFSMEHQGCIKADTCPENGGGGTSTQSTTTTTTERPVTPPCSSLESETIGDPNDCSKFIYCHQGYPYTVQCNPGTYYSKEHDGCIYASECPSGGGSGSTTPPPTTVEPPITAPCTSENLEVHGNPEDCTQYFYCYEGFPYVVQCQVGSYFSEEYQACIEADQCPADVETSTLPSTSQSTTPETTSSPIIDPCTSLGSEVFGDPDDCTQYTYCYLGEPHTVQCAIGEYFSEDYGVCIEAFECPATATATPSTVTPSPTSPITTPTIDTSSPTPPITIPTAGTPSPTPSVTPSPTSPITVPTIDTSSPTSPITIPTIGTTSPTTETTTPPNPIIPPCSSHEPEFIPNPNDCTRYTYCCVGIPIPMYCTEGEYFSESERMCVKSSECPQGGTTNTELTTPTTIPTTEPTTIPTTEPSTIPSTEPTTIPTTEPTTIATTEPTTIPTTEPTTIPTTESTTIPTTEPTTIPTTEPTTIPTTEPTTPHLVPPCTSLDVETFPMADDCMRYIYCIYGIPYPVQCANGQYYSQENNSCILAEKCPQ